MTTTLSRVADYSIILGGRAGVGKSSLYHRLIKGSFPEEPRFTSGHYEDGLERGVYHTHVNGDEVKVHVHNTGTRSVVRICILSKAWYSETVYTGTPVAM